MRYLFLLFLLPLSASAQKAYILHRKVATGVDTVFNTATGLLQVDSAITINGVHYSAIAGQQTEDPMTNEIFIPYTLPNGWTALVRRFSNLEIMSVTVDKGSEQDAYYTR